MVVEDPDPECKTSKRQPPPPIVQLKRRSLVAVLRLICQPPDIETSSIRQKIERGVWGSSEQWRPRMRWRKRRRSAASYLSPPSLSNPMSPSSSPSLLIAFTRSSLSNSNHYYLQCPLLAGLVVCSIQQRLRFFCSFFFFFSCI